MRTPLSRRPAPAAELGADQVELAPTASTASFGAYLGYFLGLGTWGFGGPIATVGYMQRDVVSGFGRYNAVAAAAGSLGALAAAAPHLLRRALPTAPADQTYFLALTVMALLGAYAATRLSVAVEAEPAPRTEPAASPAA